MYQLGGQRGRHGNDSPPLLSACQRPAAIGIPPDNRQDLNTVVLCSIYNI